MPLLYLDATLNYSDPSETDLKYLKRVVDPDGTVRSEWAAPTDDADFYDATGNWSVPELVPNIPNSEEFNKYSWAEIAKLSAKAAKNPEPFMYMVDADHKLEKDVHMSYKDGNFQREEDFKALLIGIAQNVRPNGNVIGFTFQMRDFGFSTAMAIYDTYGIGWNRSRARTTTMPLIRERFPDDLRSVLKTASIGTCMSPNAQSYTTTEDSLFCPSYYEIFGNTCPMYGYNYDFFALEGEWYNWYESHNNNDDRIITIGSSGAQGWWTRTFRSSERPGGDVYCIVDAKGGPGAVMNWASGYYACPCFCV